MNKLSSIIHELMFDIIF